MSQRKILVPLDVHNAFKECYETQSATIQKVHPFLAPLLTQLSKKRPRWTFVSHSVQFGEAYNFKIIEDGEELGSVWVETHWRTSERKFAFDNPRLRAKRERGRHTETKDIKKAAKLIIENMYATTPSEFVAKARNTAAGAFQNHLYGFHRRHSGVVLRINETLHRFAADCPDVIKEYDPASANAVDEFIAARADAGMANTLHGIHVNGDTTLLTQRGDKFYVEKTSNPGVFAAHSLDELDDYYRQVVGALKLAPNHTLIPDLGFRVDENTFIAFPEAKTPSLDTV